MTVTEGEKLGSFWRRRSRPIDGWGGVSHNESPWGGGYAAQAEVAATQTCPQDYPRQTASGYGRGWTRLQVRHARSTRREITLGADPDTSPTTHRAHG